MEELRYQKKKSHALRLADGTRMECRQPNPNAALTSYPDDSLIL